MGAARRLEWIRRGRPFRLVRPLVALRDRLRAYGYSVYDIGNTDHLESDPPEDHTPYSATGWPGTATYGRGYAIDIMPPTKAGLPSLQQLGAQLLADRKANVPGIRWLKYMNWEPQRNWGGDCWHESWQPTYRRTRSSDRGHIHLSAVTGLDDSTVGDGYDPVARTQGDDMPTAKEIADEVWKHPLVRQAERPAPAGVLLANGFDRLINAQGEIAKVRADVAQLSGRDLVDEPAIVDGVLAGLGTKPVADVAVALVAAGQDPAALAAELSRLASEAESS